MRSQLLSHICVSRKLLSLIVKGELSFVRGDDHWFTRDYIGMSSNQSAIGWATCPLKEVYDRCGPDIQDEIILRRDDTGKHSGEVRALMFPDAAALLENFKPKEWESEVDKMMAYSLGRFRIVNMVWAQIILLDVAIQYLARGGWYDGKGRGSKAFSGRVVGVIKAIEKCWSKKPRCGGLGLSGENGQEELEASFTEWDLTDSLKEHSGLVYSYAEEEQERKIQQLSNLLELRALFVLAFMILCPDASDVYLAEDSQVEMPMV